MSHPLVDALLRNKQEEEAAAAEDVTTGAKASGLGKIEDVTLLKPPWTLMLTKHTTLMLQNTSLHFSISPSDDE